MKKPKRHMHPGQGSPMFHSEAFEDPVAPADSDIDWTPALIGQHGAAAQIKTPLGDPTRWGANNKGGLTGPSWQYQDQTIQAQTVDPYSRNWQIIGNVGTSAIVWTFDTFEIQLELTMGVGQTTIVQLMDLRALIANAEPFYADREYFYQGLDILVKPFAISGGIIGHSVNARIRARYSDLAAASRIYFEYDMLIAPLAAGTGI